jgi:diacylglycerol kinase family enzyme
VFVSNIDPWTYLHARPIRTNPGTSTEGGLGVFALTSMRLHSVVRLTGQLLRTGGVPSSKALLRDDDVSCLTVRCSKPVGLQVDGDYLGLRDEAEFASVPNALRVLTGVPARLRDDN